MLYINVTYQLVLFYLFNVILDERSCISALANALYS